MEMTQEAHLREMQNAQSQLQQMKEVIDKSAPVDMQRLKEVNWIVRLSMALYTHRCYWNLLYTNLCLVKLDFMLSLHWELLACLKGFPFSIQTHKKIFQPSWLCSCETYLRRWDPRSWKIVHVSQYFLKDKTGWWGLVYDCQPFLGGGGLSSI